MSEFERLQFFREALALCVRWQRSPRVARVINGRALTLRQVMTKLSEGGRLPVITTVEARTLAGEFTGFGYREILTGLSSSSAARSSRRGSRRSSRSSRTRGRSGLTPGGSCRAPRAERGA